MIFRPSTQADLDYVKAAPFEGAVKDYPYLTCPDDNTITTIYEGYIVAVGGVFIPWEGKGTFWLILRDDAKKHGFHGILALSAIRDKVDYLFAKNELKSAQATVRPELEESVKMIEWLGFERKCLMEKYCPDGGDTYLYERIP